MRGCTLNILVPFRVRERERERGGEGMVSSCLLDNLLPPIGVLLHDVIMSRACLLLFLASSNCTVS